MNERSAQHSNILLTFSVEPRQKKRDLSTHANTLNLPIHTFKCSLPRVHIHVHTHTVSSYTNTICASTTLQVIICTNVKKRCNHSSKDGETAATMHQTCRKWSIMCRLFHKFHNLIICYIKIWCFRKPLTVMERQKASQRTISLLCYHSSQSDVSQ